MANQFTYDLVADGIGGETSRVLFDMGAEVGIVNIDDVSVQLKVGDDCCWLLNLVLKR